MACNAQIISPGTHLILSGFNDSWGGGFTQIRDDRRSVGFQADYQSNVGYQKWMQTRLRYSVFTNKFAQQDSSRLDEVELLVSYPIYGYRGFWLKVEGGGYLTGNLGGEKLQNKTHDAVGVDALALPYPSETKVYPLLGGSFMYEFILSLPLSLEGGYRLAPGYTQHLFGRLILGNHIYNFFQDYPFYQFSIGYDYTQVFTNDATRAAVAQAENGFSLNYDMRAGIFNYGIRVYPANQFALGTLGITVFRPKKDRANYAFEGDFSSLAEFGGLLDGGLFMRLATPPITGVRDDLFGFELRYQFWTYGKDELGEDPNQLGHYQQLTLGFTINPIRTKPKLQLLPFAVVGFGFRGEYLYKANDQTDRKTVNSAALTFEGGLRLKFPSFGFAKDCNYGLSVSGISSFSGKLEDAIYYNDFLFGQTMYQLSLGAFVMIDL